MAITVSVQSLSISTVNSISLCSEKEWLSKIVQEPSSRMSVNLVTGISLHQSAEVLFLHRKHNEAITIDVLKRVYQITFDSITSRTNVVYGNKTKEEIEENSFQLLALLLEQDVGEVVAVELPVHYQMTLSSTGESVGFIGRIDLVTRNSDGDLVIWDLKSAGRRYGEDEYRKVTEQLLLYRKGLAEPAHLAVMALYKTKKPSIEVTRLRPEEYNISEEELINRFLMVKRTFESQIHYKQRGWQCNGCGMSHICNADNRNQELELHLLRRSA